MLLHSNGKKSRRATAKDLKVLALSTRVCARELRNYGGLIAIAASHYSQMQLNLSAHPAGGFFANVARAAAAMFAPNKSMQPTAFGGG